MNTKDEEKWKLIGLNQAISKIADLVKRLKKLEENNKSE